MAGQIRTAFAGVGNNVSALLQGIEFYRKRSERAEDISMPGLRRISLGGFQAWDILPVCAFDISLSKVGLPLAQAISSAENNYPMLHELADLGPTVAEGIRQDTVREDIARVAEVIRSAGTEVLVYGLPSGLQWAAEAYAQAAMSAGVALINCTPEVIARDPALMRAFRVADLPLIGDDLASHFGTSVVHEAILSLLASRGLTLENSYQLNLGGNSDFRNLVQHGDSKGTSKLNALSDDPAVRTRVIVVPAAAYVPLLGDRKIAHLQVRGLGWAASPVTLDVKLEVQDSSNAAGVIIDLVRIAGAMLRRRVSGFDAAAAPLLKSPPLGRAGYDAAEVGAAEDALDS